MPEKTMLNGKSSDELLCSFRDIEKTLSDLISVNYRFYTEEIDVLCENTEKINIVRENSNNINQVFMENKVLLNKLHDLNEYPVVLSERLTHHEKKHAGAIEAMEFILAGLSLYKNPFQNFSKNIGKLKSLLEDLKLVNKKNNSAFQGFAVDETKRIESVLTKVDNTIPFFLENIHNIKSHTKNLHKNLLDLHDGFLPNIFAQLDKGVMMLGRLKSHFYNSSQFNLNKIGAKCFRIIQQIVQEFEKIKVVNNQLEHVFEAHEKLTNEFSLNKKSNHAINNNGNGKKYYSNNISIIMEIEALQVLLVKKRQSAIIKKVAKGLSELQELFYELNVCLNKINKIGGESLKKSLTSTTEIFSDINGQTRLYLKSFNQIETEITDIKNVFKHLFERFMDVDMMDNSIEQLIINKLSEANYLNSPDEEKAAHSQQLLKVYADNHFEKQSIKQLFESINDELVTITNTTSICFSYKGVTTIEQLNDKVERLYEAARNQISIIAEKCDDTIDLNYDILYVFDKLADRIKTNNVLQNSVEELVVIFCYINPEILNCKNKSVEDILQKISVKEIEKKYSVRVKHILENDNTYKNFLTQIIIPKSVEYTFYSAAGT